MSFQFISSLNSVGIKSWFLLVTNMVLISYFLVVCLLIVRFVEVPEPVVPEPCRRVEGPTLGLSVRPFVRTTPSSQILCQGLKRVKNTNFNDKISDFAQNRLKNSDKISEITVFWCLFDEITNYMVCI